MRALTAILLTLLAVSIPTGCIFSTATSRGYVGGMPNFRNWLNVAPTKPLSIHSVRESVLTKFPPGTDVETVFQNLPKDDVNGWVTHYPDSCPVPEECSLVVNSEPSGPCEPFFQVEFIFEQGVVKDVNVTTTAVCL